MGWIPKCITLLDPGNLLHRAVQDMPKVEQTEEAKRQSKTWEP